jgi:hypothetical protein
MPGQGSRPARNSVNRLARISALIVRGRCPAARSSPAVRGNSAGALVTPPTLPPAPNPPPVISLPDPPSAPTVAGNRRDVIAHPFGIRGSFGEVLAGDGGNPPTQRNPCTPYTPTRDDRHQDREGSPPAPTGAAQTPPRLGTITPGPERRTAPTREDHPPSSGSETPTTQATILPKPEGDPLRTSPRPQEPQEPHQPNRSSNSNPTKHPIVDQRHRQAITANTDPRPDTNRAGASAGPPASRESGDAGGYSAAGEEVGGAVCQRGEGCGDPGLA